MAARGIRLRLRGGLGLALPLRGRAVRNGHRVMMAAGLLHHLLRHWLLRKLHRSGCAAQPGLLRVRAARILVVIHTDPPLSVGHELVAPAGRPGAVRRHEERSVLLAIVLRELVPWRARLV